jgi:hypothetical protein
MTEKIKLIMVPLGTHNGMVCTNLQTPQGERVQLRQQYIHRDHEPGLSPTLSHALTTWIVS